jgi:hypothetical protein
LLYIKEILPLPLQAFLKMSASNSNLVNFRRNRTLRQAELLTDLINLIDQQIPNDPENPSCFTSRLFDYLDNHNPGPDFFNHYREIEDVFDRDNHPALAPPPPAFPIIEVTVLTEEQIAEMNQQRLLREAEEEQQAAIRREERLLQQTIEMNRRLNDPNFEDLYG